MMTMMLTSQDYKISWFNAWLKPKRRKRRSNISKYGPLREKAIRCMTEDDKTKKQAESKLENKEKQKNKLKSSYFIYCRWSEQLLQNISWCWSSTCIKPRHTTGFIYLSIHLYLSIHIHYKWPLLEALQ